MPLFRKKPVVIEARQWEVNLESEEDLRDFGVTFVEDPNTDYLIIQTLEGPMVASPWDWIVKGVEGEFYAVKPSVFKKTYEPIDDTNNQ